MAKILTIGTSNRHAGALDLAFLALLKTARLSPTVVMATPPHERLSASFKTVVSSFSHHFPCSFLCEHRELVQQGCRLLESGERSWKQRFRSLQTIVLELWNVQEGSMGLFVQIMTYKIGSKIEDVEDRLNELLGTR